MPSVTAVGGCICKWRNCILILHFHSWQNHLWTESKQWNISVQKGNIWEGWEPLKARVGLDSFATITITVITTVDSLNLRSWFWKESPTEVSGAPERTEANHICRIKPLSSLNSVSWKAEKIVTNVTPLCSGKRKSNWKINWSYRAMKLEHVL